MKIIAPSCVSPSERSYKHSPTGGECAEIIAYAMAEKIDGECRKNQISYYEKIDNSGIDACPIFPIGTRC